MCNSIHMLYRIYFVLLFLNEKKLDNFYLMINYKYFFKKMINKIGSINAPSTCILYIAILFYSY